MKAKKKKDESDKDYGFNCGDINFKYDFTDTLYDQIIFDY